MSINHILITGASGLIGRQLTKKLLDKGYQVSHLSRSPKQLINVKTYLWDINRGVIDENCIQGVDLIVHLAGAGITDERWTDKRKKVLIDSRTKSIKMIYKLLQTRPHQVKKVISASATGYYNDRGNELMTEDSPPSKDFLAHCCVLWEQAVNEGVQLDLKILKFRTGVVISEQDGALPKIAAPVKFGIGAALGSCKQWVPWIHLDDVVAMYLYGIEQFELTGVYNMVAPEPVTNKQLTKAIAKQLKRPLWLPNIPAALLKLMLGEMATVVLGSTKVSAEKTEQTGYQFKFTKIEAALREIYG